MGDRRILVFKNKEYVDVIDSQHENFYKDCVVTHPESTRLDDFLYLDEETSTKIMCIKRETHNRIREIAKNNLGKATQVTKEGIIENCRLEYGE